MLAPLPEVGVVARARHPHELREHASRAAVVLDHAASAVGAVTFRHLQPQLVMRTSPRPPGPPPPPDVPDPAPPPPPPPPGAAPAPPEPPMAAPPVLPPPP